MPPCRGQCARVASGTVDRGEMHDQVAEEMEDAAGIFFPEASKRSICAPGIEWENGFQVRRGLSCGMKLLGAESGNAHHADIAVAPRLRRNPFDKIVAVPLPGSAAVRLADPARRADDVDIATRHKELRVTCFQQPSPQRRPRWLWRQRRGDVRTLHVLIIDRERQQYRKLLICIRSIYIDR